MQKVQFMFIISLVFAIFVTIFALTNASPVEINLFFYKFVASQALVIFISAAFGAVIVTFLGAVRYIKLISQVKALRKENEELAEKVQGMTEELDTKAHEVETEIDIIETVNEIENKEQ